MEGLEERLVMDGGGSSLVFDFGTARTPLAPGAIPVNLTLYNPTGGFGWTGLGGGTSAGLYGHSTDPLKADANWSPDNTFHVNLPNGTYTVQPDLLGKLVGNGSPTQIYAEGRSVASTQQSRFTTTVTDGVLDLRLTNFVLAGLTITGSNLKSIDAGPNHTINEGDTVAFQGTTFSAPGSTFLWQFGDGASVSGTLTPVHTYEDNGTYTVTFSAIDSSGNAIRDTSQVVVNDVAPTVALDGPYNVVTGSPVALSALVSDPGAIDTEQGFTYSWSFGDGSTGSDPQPSHTYSQPGTYQVRLTVKDKDGLVSNVATTTVSVAAYLQDATVPLMMDTIPNFGAHPTIMSVSSGSWSDPNTWSLGRVPSAGDVVSITNNTVVSYDQVSNQALDTIVVQAGGSLHFRNDINTKVVVANILVLPNGDLEVGTPDAPIRPNVSAQIVIADQAINLTMDPSQYGTGLIGLGKVTMSGSPMSSTFMRVAVAPKAGDTTIRLAQPVTGWHPGDRLYLPDSRQLAWNETDSKYVSQNEHPTLASISADGTVLTLAGPLQFNHFGAANSDGVVDSLPHVADLSRNVEISSQNPDGTRGHVMFADRADVDVRYVGFVELGRTLNEPLDNTTFDASGNVTHIGTNQIARYPLHTHHLIGPEQPQADGYQFTLIGNTVDGGDQVENYKWGITIHGSHYGLIQDNVVDNVAGAGIVTEDGSESHNVFDHNFVAEVHGTGTRVDTLGVAGEGYWFHGIDNTVVDNVATNVRGGPFGYGFYVFGYFVGSQMVPAHQGANPMMPGGGMMVNMNSVTLPEFSGNEVYGATTDGLSLWWIGTTWNTPDPNVGESVIKDFKAWNIYGLGYFGYQTNHVTFDGFTTRGDMTKGNTTGMTFKDYFQRDLVIRNADIEGMNIGIVPSTWSDNAQTIEDSYFSNYVDIAMQTLWTSGYRSDIIPSRTVILRNDKFDTRIQTNRAGQTPLAISMDYTAAGSRNLILKDQVLVYDYNQVAGDNFQVYYNEQSPTFVLPQTTYNSDGTPSMNASPLAGLTNQQAWQRYGVAIAGAVAPTSTRRSWIKGFVRSF